MSIRSVQLFFWAPHIKNSVYYIVKEAARMLKRFLLSILKHPRRWWITRIESYKEEIREFSNRIERIDKEMNKR